jgi:hypothetical protein
MLNACISSQQDRKLIARNYFESKLMGIVRKNANTGLTFQKRLSARVCENDFGCDY